MTQKKIAITHASSLLAEALIEQLAKAGLDADYVVLLDQSGQAGNRLSFGDTYITVLDQYEYDYEDLVAILLLQADEELQDLLQHADCFVLSHFAEENLKGIFFDSDSDMASLNPSVGPLKLAGAEVSTLLGVLRPLDDLFEINALRVVNVQSVSLLGKAAVDELASQTIDLLNGREVSSNVFPLQLAFNMIPLPNNETEQDGLARFFKSDQIRCSVQNIMVPAFHGLSISVMLESDQAIDLVKVNNVIESLAGITLSSARVSPFSHCMEENKCIIFGLNQPQNDIKRLQFWIIADSVRNGLLNNYQKAIDFLLKSYL